MPKMYTEKEREYIIKKLKEAALRGLTLHGVKKTTVDDIVNTVNIPKGTFYLFYKSKELLLFDVINDIHNDIQTQLLNKVACVQGNMTSEQLTDLIFEIFKEIDNTCLLKIMTNGDLELLMRKLPDNIVAEHLAHDDFSIDQLFHLIPQAKEKNIEYFSGAFRGIFLTLLYKREIGEDIFEEALKLMINGLVLQLMEE